MKIKRDITTQSAPAPDQLEVGELAFNATTGTLYAKRVDGTVIKWIGTALCDTETFVGSIAVPALSFPGLGSFCCGGAPLTVFVDNLVVDNRYRLLITDLTVNSTVAVSEYNTELIPVSSSRRSVILNINIGKSNPTAIFKFSVYQIVKINNVDTNILKSEQVLYLTCQNC